MFGALGRVAGVVGRAWLDACGMHGIPGMRGVHGMRGLQMF